MPIYEYVCDKCGERFEWLVRSGEEPACPSCAEKRLTKQLSLPAAHVVGAKSPACPAKESGSCAASADCSGRRCQFGDW